MSETTPTPHELWIQAGEDGDRYRELLREHGHVLWPGGTGYAEGTRNLPCGWPGEPAPVSDSYCRHLLTIEAAPADEMNLYAPGDPMAFVSRCICGHDIPWGPYPQVMLAIGEHLASAGLLEETGAGKRAEVANLRHALREAAAEMARGAAAERKRIRGGMAALKFTLWRPGNGPAHGEEFEVVPAEALEKLLGEGP
jgi:hypothetical protein